MVHPLQFINYQGRDPCSLFTPFNQRHSAEACGLEQLTYLQTASELLTEGQVRRKPRDWMPQWGACSAESGPVTWSHLSLGPWAFSTKAFISLLPPCLCCGSGTAHIPCTELWIPADSVVLGSWRKSREAFCWLGVASACPQMWPGARDVIS